MKKKKAILISDTHELYKSLWRALSTLYGIELYWLEGRDELKKQIRGKVELALILVVDVKDLFYEWFWGQIRKQFRNPIIVLGSWEKEDFERENPVFKSYPYNHKYLPIPFWLEDLYKIIQEVKPIYDIFTMKLIFDNYSDYAKFLWNAIDHDIPGGDKYRCIYILEKTKVFFEMKGQVRIVGPIKDGIKKIKKSPDCWAEVAYSLREELKINLSELIKNRK